MVLDSLLFFMAKGQILKIPVTSLFIKTKHAIETLKKKVVVHEGATRSGKTTAILQYLSKERADVIGDKVTIARETFAGIKDTVLFDFEEVVDTMKIKIYPDINRNRSTQTYSVGNNGGEISFIGLDNFRKLKGRWQDITWINEAIDISKQHFDQLEQRTNKFCILDYNPSEVEHWIYNSVIPRDDAILIHSTFKNNPFLPNAIVKKILSYEPTPENIRQGTADKYMWEVYGLGIRAKVEGVVFPYWEEIDRIPDGARFLAYGLDFGFSSDPAALVAVYKYDSGIIIDELLYAHRLTNKDLSEQFEALGIDKEAEIIADCAEPKSIEEIFRLGWNIKAARKGDDSIRYGIKVMSNGKIRVTSRSINLKNEMRKYKYAQDSAGNFLKKPVDKWNHCIDGARYVCIIKLGGVDEEYGIAEFF